MKNDLLFPQLLNKLVFQILMHYVKSGLRSDTQARLRFDPRRKLHGVERPEVRQTDSTA